MKTSVEQLKTKLNKKFCQPCKFLKLEKIGEAMQLFNDFASISL